MWRFNEVDYRKWLVPAAERFNTSGGRPDLFERYLLDIEVSDEADIQAALTSVYGFWGKNKFNPKFGTLLGVLLGEHRDAGKKLLDPERRSTERGFAEESRRMRDAERFSELKGSIAILVGDKSYITPDELASLLERYGKKGFSEAEIRAQIGAIPIHERIETRSTTRFQEGLPASVRAQIRQQLAALGLRDLHAFLNVPAGYVKDKWVSACNKTEQDWRPRPADRKKTAANTLLGIVKTHLIDNPEKYRYCKQWEALEQLRPDVELAASDRVVSAGEFQTLLRAAMTKHGLVQAEAHEVIQTLADEFGARIEAPKSETVTCGNCGSTVPLKGAPDACPTCSNPLWQLCPKCGNRAPSTAMACVKCGFVLGNTREAELLVQRAEAAFNAGRLHEASQAIGSAHEIWGDGGKVGELFDRIEERRREVVRLCAQIGQNLAERKLFAARQGLESLMELATDWEIPYRGPALEVSAEVEAQIGAARSRLSNGRRLQESGDVAGALDEYLLAIGIAKDFDEGHAAVASCPPESPVKVAAEQQGEWMEISWEGMSKGQVSYVVRRSDRGPAVWGQGTEVATTSSGSCRDTTISPGSSVYYTVFARRGEAVSGGVTTGPHLFASEVRNLKVDSYDSQVVGSWDPVAYNCRVRVVRRTGEPPTSISDGKTVASVTLTGFDDKDVVNEDVYFYRVAVEYPQASGTFATTPGKVFKGVPRAPLGPVEKLEITPGDSGGITISWPRPGRGEVRVYRVQKKPDVKCGGQLTASELSEWVSPLVARTPNSVYDPSPPLRQPVFYLPVTIAGPTIVAGCCREFVMAPDVTELAAEDSGDKVTLRWKWPENCDNVRIAWSSKTYPVSDVDKEGFKDEKRNAGETSGAVDVEVSGPTFFTAFAVYASGSGQIFGPGIHPECHAEVRTGLSHDLAYRVERSRGRLFGAGRRMTLFLTAKAHDIPRLPEMIIISRRGNAPPTSPEQGEVLERLDSGIYLPKDDNFSLEFELNQPPVGLRLFFADKGQYKHFRLMHPSDPELCFK